MAKEIQLYEVNIRLSSLEIIMGDKLSGPS